MTCDIDPAADAPATATVTRNIPEEETGTDVADTDDAVPVNNDTCSDTTDTDVIVNNSFTSKFLCHICDINDSQASAFSSRSGIKKRKKLYGTFRKVRRTHTCFLLQIFLILA